MNNPEPDRPNAADPDRIGDAGPDRSGDAGPGSAGDAGPVRAGDSELGLVRAARADREAVAGDPAASGPPGVDRARPLSGPLNETARAFLRDGRPVAEARPASTVILLRDGTHAGAPAVQVYLLRRTTSMAFAAGMSVFPGGRVDAADASVADSWVGPPPADFAARLGCTPELAGAFVAAAVRETFEESGVLLAGPSASSVVADTTGEDWENDRIALEGRSLSFADFLHRRGLVLRADLLGAWAHWVTPEFEPRRYDTRFFVAVLPAGQVTRDVSGESDQVAWMTAADATRLVDAGELAMMPPTYVCCQEVAAYTRSADVLEASRDRTITTVLPRLRVDGDQTFLETT